MECAGSNIVKIEISTSVDNAAFYFADNIRIAVS